MKLRLASLAVAAVALSACRMDATIQLTVAADGSGTVRVEAIADGELIERAPGLIDDLRFDDLAGAGWVITGPEATSAGGWRVEMVHPFSTVEEAEVLLGTMNGPGGPLVGMTLTRTITDTRAEVVLAGTLRVTDGLDAFADAEMIDAVGATPYADDLEADSLALGDVVGVVMVADLPGDVAATDAERSGSTVSWQVPLDGSAQVIQASGLQTRDAGKWWRLGSTAALVGFVAWVSISAIFLLYVLGARFRRRRLLRTHDL